MDHLNKKTVMQTAAYTAIAGALCALTGAALWGASGADIDRALANGTIPDYLVVVGENTGLLVANLTIWILMAFLLGVAGTAMATLGERRPMTARVAMFAYWTGVPLVTAAYVAWLAIVLEIAPAASAEAVLLARTLGWFASRADWIATILIVGAGPALISFAGRDDWVPAWLARWSILAVIAAFLNALAMLTGGSGLTSYGFLIIPVGVSWMIAAGIMLFRRLGKAE